MIQCKMCGGSVILTPDRTIGVCEYCGSTNTYGKISDEQRAAAFNRGNDFRRAGEFDNALAAYEQILREDDTDAEAHWCAALCRFGIDYVRDPDTLEWFPTCHRASFNSFLEDVDYLAALEHSDGITRLQYRKDATKIAEVQKGILATSQNEEPYDVFICFKDKGEDGQRTPDSILAQEIYYQLTERGHRVFFSRITLEGKGGAEYEPYIFAALNSAKVMVAVGTSPEHFNSVWVKNEWSRFLALMRKDRNKMLLPCYRDMDPYYLPEQLKILQSYDMGKIGFIQDLIHGVDKVVRAEKKPAVTETVVVQQNAATNVTALVKRGNMALEDGDWKQADSFFDKALNQDAELAEAYLGIFLAEYKSSSLKRFEQLWETLEPKIVKKEACERNRKAEDEAVRKYTIPGILSAEQIRNQLDANRYYDSAEDSRRVQLEQLQRIFHTNRNLMRAISFGDRQLRKEIETMQKKLLKLCEERLAAAQKEDSSNRAAVIKLYHQHIDKCIRVVEEQHRELKQSLDERYEKLRALEKKHTKADCIALINGYSALGSYADASVRKLTIEVELDRYYRVLTNKQRDATSNGQYKKLLEQYQEIISYKDCAARADKCRAVIQMNKEEREVTMKLLYILCIPLLFRGIRSSLEVSVGAALIITTMIASIPIGIRFWIESRRK